MGSLNFGWSFRSIDWGGTFYINMLRSVAAGVVWPCVMYGVSLSDPSKPFDMGMFALPLAMPFIYVLMILPASLIAQVISRITDGVVASVFGFVILMLAIFILVGDPLIYSIGRAWPPLLRGIKFRIINPYLTLFVIKEAAEFE